MKFITSLALLLIASVGMAQGVPNTFTAGTPALAAEVNENFVNLDTRTSDLDGRVATLELQAAELLAALERASPDADLTGTTYCIFGQGTWLFAEPDVSASITANPFAARLDFTSPTELTSTGIYDPVTSIVFPPIAINDVSDLSDDFGTYTVVGNLLTVTVTDNGESETTPFIMTPDAQVFVGGFFERAADGDLQTWETGMVVGVRAANCDGLF